MNYRTKQEIISNKDRHLIKCLTSMHPSKFCCTPKEMLELLGR